MPCSRRRTGGPNRSSARSPAGPGQVPRPPASPCPLRPRRSPRPPEGSRRSGSARRLILARRRHRPRRPAWRRRCRAGKACSWRHAEAVRRPSPRTPCRCLEGMRVRGVARILPRKPILTPATRRGPAAAPLTAAGDAGVDHQRRGRGGPGRDYPRRALPYPNPVHGRTEVLGGGIRVRRTDDLGRAFLPVRLASHVLLGVRNLVVV